MGKARERERKAEQTGAPGWGVMKRARKNCTTGLARAVGAGEPGGQSNPSCQPGTKAGERAGRGAGSTGQ